MPNNFSAASPATGFSARAACFAEVRAPLPPMAAPVATMIDAAMTLEKMEPPMESARTIL